MARSEKHPGGSTFYTALETAGLRMTVRKLVCRHENPPPTLFRMTEQAKQLSFALGDKLIAEISYGFDANILEAPQFVDVRFPDGEGGYLEDTIDLLDLLREPIPEEVVEEKRDTKLRDRRTSKPNFIE